MITQHSEQAHATYRNLSAAHLQPLNDVLQGMLRAIRSYRHRRLIVSAKEVVISVSARDVAAIFAEIEH